MIALQKAHKEKQLEDAESDATDSALKTINPAAIIADDAVEDTKSVDDVVAEAKMDKAAEKEI